MPDAILVFLKLNILFTITGLLLGMPAYKLCIWYAAIFFRENSKVCLLLFLLLLE